MVELTNLSKSYSKGAVKAVDDLSLIVNNGEIFGFLGPNGAGKTTTIKMMVGLLNPESGSVLVNGHSIAKDPLAVKRSISFVPDSPEVYEKLTGFEYLNFMGDVYSLPTDLRRERLTYLPVCRLRLGSLPWNCYGIDIDWRSAIFPPDQDRPEPLSGY